MFNVYIIGAGQIGSRHLQALKKVRISLNITVIDPSEQSLSTARKRYEETPAGICSHTLNYLRKIPGGQNINLAIIATTSNIRAKVIRDILKKNQISYFILEKLLFDKKRDYGVIEKVFSRFKIKAWVNCPLRIRPIYKKIKDELANKDISLRITGSQWGLATNAIHHLDFISYLTGDTNYSVNTRFLDKKTIPSKRKGFLELNGTLYVNFKNGSKCEFTNYASGNAPRLIELSDKDTRYIIQESNNKAWASNAKDGWKWKEISFKNPLVSETTTTAVESIINNGNCPFTPYKESAKIHLLLLESLLMFLNKRSQKKYDNYPFT